MKYFLIGFYYDEVLVDGMFKSKYAILLVEANNFNEATEKIEYYGYDDAKDFENLTIHDSLNMDSKGLDNV